MNDATVWPCLNYRDAPAAIEFLTTVLGFEARLVVPGDESRTVAHAELRWPEGGGVMLGSADEGGNEFARLPTGVASVYVVTDDPDGLHDRAVAGGAQIIRPLADEDYGQRGFSLRDPEGNLWSFGSYRGAP